MKKKLLAAALALLPAVAPARTPATNRPAVSQAAPVANTQTQGEPHPAIWLLSDGDTRIYLFGSVHLLNPALRWRSAAFNRIAREAQELVLEASDRELAERGPNPLVLMRMNKSVPILQRVSPGRRDGLARMLREMQVPEGLFDRIETWGAAMLLGAAQMARHSGGSSGALAADPASGVEAVLIREFHSSGRPISGAESGTALIAGFRGMPLNVQQALLDEAVDAYLGSAGDWELDEAGWARGNLDIMAAAIEALPPGLHDLLITRRNRGFADWLAHRLERPGTILFAIGAGHLAGRVSVQSMLESRGLHVQRIY
jgi:uncharacterized protein YbaP (TraB family)